MSKDIMAKLGLGDYLKDFENGICPDCREQIDMLDFRDDISLTEYSISGMCQKCQDRFFSN